MIITFEIFLYILFVHFLADFALQTHEQATKKSTDWIYLTFHVITYSLCWLIASYILFGVFSTALAIFVITFFAHWITDYCTSRIGKIFWDKNDYHNGFVVVGFDQILHYIQLFLTIGYFLNQ
jgi:putative Mn2+ efflux pump MntP